MEEIWKPIVGYEGLYEVSSWGAVRSLNYNHGRIVKVMAAWVTPKDYECIHLSKNGVVRAHRISRLVASAFIPNPQNKPFVDHIDANRRNNHVENLRWCDQSENQRNPISRIRYGISKARAVVQMSKNGDTIRVWASATEAERSGHYNRNQIIKACTGKLKTHNGYRWRYENETERH